MTAGAPIKPQSTGEPGRPVPSDRRTRVWEACAYCVQRRHLRRTASIALVVGVILTAINQSGVIASGHATTATWVRCGLNFVVPFLVSDAGLLSARR